MRRAIAFILATQCVVVAVIHAQAPPASLYPGSVLRIGTLRGGHVSGQLFRSDADGVVVRQDGDTTRVAWRDMRYLQIARAARSGTQVRDGAIAGGVVGLLAGLGVSAFCSGFTIMGSEPEPCPEAIPIGLFGGLALGAGIGAVVQGPGSGGGWIDIPLDHTRVGIVPTDAGVAMGARIAF
ncbi:MAG: hypothetical protein AMS20_05140 [Gemmatimonas sp. SG8_28]|nr:MAG: hypothetical protein AMS20_05140 [Gemmatimonas sp. SG8_28]